MNLVNLLLGLALLAVGGELLVRGSVAVAKRLGMSPLLVGLTLVGFGTSTPELVTSVQASLAGSPGIAVGNVVGSNIANLLLVLGVTAAVCPIPVSDRVLRQDLRILIGVTGLFVLLSMALPLGRLVGLALVGSLVAYVYYSWKTEAPHAAPSVPNADPLPRNDGLALPLGIAVGGIVAVIFGGKFLVDAASAIARGWGVSETLIGLTIVAVGTSLPEFVTSVVAAYRREPDVALGNVLGSGIYNVLFIGGSVGLIAPAPVPADIAWGHNLAMLAATLVTAMFLRHDARLTRREGACLLGLYACYLVAIAPR